MISRRFMVLLPATHMQSTIFLFLCFVLRGSARDTITPVDRLRDGGPTLVSAGEIFELGFFTPNESSRNRRFVGIWYYGLEIQTVVWVANRDQPLSPFSPGVFAIGEDCELKVWDGNGTVVWSSSYSQHSLSCTGKIVKLMDSGNLVLRDNSSGETFWQSFDVPTDTFLFGMKMDATLLTLTSWLSSDNPASGNYTFKQGPGQDEYIIMENEIQYWSSGDSGSTYEEGIDEVRSLLSNSSEAGSLISNLTKTHKLRLVLTYSGEIQYYIWPNSASPRWRAPKDRCSAVSACGKFGVCNTENYFMCKCLPGYEPRNPARWRTRDFSDGCTRNSAFCEKNSSGDDTFLHLEMTKVGIPKSPDSIFPKHSNNCRQACLDDCQCLAYILSNTMPRRIDPQLKCLFLTDDLTDLQEGYPSVTYDLFVRVASSDIKPTARSCRPCGSTTIPYPLSDGSNCGDPLYSNFTCEKGTNQLMFVVNDYAYPVSTINPERSIFLIQLREADNCSSQSLLEIIPALDPPFWMTGECKDAGTANGGSKKSIEVEISWHAPKEPLCTSEADCKDWPNSTCVKGDGDKDRCFCIENFYWDSSSLECTKRSGNFQGPSQRSYSKSPSRPVVVGIIIVVLVAILGIIACIAYLRKMAITKRKENRTNAAHRMFISESHVKQLIDSEQFKEDNKKGIDVPFFELNEIQAATDNFSYANKLGQGGFGPVYKGKFAGGQEMAIKRLSRASGQGLQEFKNEVVLIAKLQHRNLVRLLGYCIEGDEKILLYEYMPNKSLDYFIFDRNQCTLLDWETRFDIIMGIARGLLYLHQDSRLKIIHRDLKTSNILLDAEMNPKISDFGLARIFDGKQVEASTERVVGTYGYMSPEYAMDGLFSQKSDVYSFGVVVLEIISGKRNTIVYPSYGTPSLLGHAWKLWEENKALELMDPMVRETCDTNQFLRCMNVGLLCVQDDPSDRPTMAAAVVLLSSDASTLPHPKQPAFVVRRDLLSSVPYSSSKPEATLDSEFLDSIEEGR